MALLVLAGAALACAPASTAPAAAPAPVPTGGWPALAVQTFDSAWSRIAHTYYDSTFHGLDWAAVRAELRPRAAAAADRAALRPVIDDMLGRLGDSHFALLPVEVARPLDRDRVTFEVPGDLGMTIRLVGGAATVASVETEGPAGMAGVRPGWIVEAIDGQRPADELAKIATLDAAAERRARTRWLWSVNELLEGGAGSSASLVMLDGGDDTVRMDIVRRRVPGRPVQFGSLPVIHTVLDYRKFPAGNGCTGVVRFNVWMVTLAQGIDRAIDELRQCRGIVIDLRGNPGGLAGMVMGVAGHFFDEQVALGTMRTRTGKLDFVANPRRATAAGAAVKPFSGRVAVVVDGLSASTSEFFAGGMQSLGRARVFGETTAGQALPATLVTLPDGDVLLHAFADFWVASGRRLEGVGVEPDEAVTLRRADLLAGRDPVLDAALRWAGGAAGHP